MAVHLPPAALGKNNPALPKLHAESMGVIGLGGRSVGCAVTINECWPLLFFSVSPTAGGGGWCSLLGSLWQAAGGITGEAVWAVLP